MVCGRYSIKKDIVLPVEKWHDKWKWPVTTHRVTCNSIYAKRPEDASSQRENEICVGGAVFFVQVSPQGVWKIQTNVFGRPSRWWWPPHTSLNVPEACAFHAARVSAVVDESHFKRAGTKKTLSLFHFLWVVKFNKPNNSLHGGQEAIVRTGHETTDCKLGKGPVKAAYCHPAYLTYTQSTSRETPGWVDDNLESRLSRELTTSDMQMTPV